MAAASPFVAVRGSDGISMINGPPSFENHVGFGSDRSPRCRVMAFSPDGSLFAWCNGQSILVVETAQYNLVCRLPKEKTMFMAFSPKGTHLSTWEQYSVSKDPTLPTTNLEIWNLKAARLVAAFSQKKKENWFV